MGEEIDKEKELFINRKKEELGIAQDDESKGIFGVAKAFLKQIMNPLKIQDEFLKDLYKKYRKLEFFDYEDMESMKSDFDVIIEYDANVFKQGFFYFGDYDIEELNKFEVDNKEAYIAKRIYKETRRNTTITRKSFSFFMKTNLNKRFHFETNLPFLELKNDTFNLQDVLNKYDLESYEELKESLSEEFYYQNFSVTSDAEILELENYTKQKLIDIFSKYNIQFLVAIKDNLLRIEVEVPTETFESEYSILYKVEKTFDELLSIFLDIERVNNNMILNNIKGNYSGIKNIIFDLDNTIIFNTEADSEYYREALENAGFTDDYFYGIYQAIDDYDKAITEENPYYNEQELLDFINRSLEQEFNMQVIDELKEVAGREWTKRILISEKVLKYLSSKYNLFVYTNYFQDVQTKRLKNIGYEKYFKNIFGADKYGCKQFKHCFEKVLAEIHAKPEECIMIGDDKSKDVIAASNLNMKSILYDYNGRRDKKDIQADDYIVIKDLETLEKIL